jgi:hypothetical protein
VEGETLAFVVTVFAARYQVERAKQYEREKGVVAWVLNARGKKIRNFATLAASNDNTQAICILKQLESGSGSTIPETLPGCH